VSNKRTYTDDQLRQAIAIGTNWSNVMVALGKTPGSGTTAVKAVAERLGLDTSHFAHRQSFKPVAAAPTLFSNRPKGGGRSGLSIAAKWFLDRGYAVSVPLEPAAYDLVTESDDGLQRVQVKTTTCQERNGRYAANVSHMRCGSPTRNANGNRRKVPYRKDEVDLFFIVTPAVSYLIPADVIDGRLSIVLDEKYAAFAV